MAEHAVEAAAVDPTYWRYSQACVEALVRRPATQVSVAGRRGMALRLFSAFSGR